jgi:hypothetical protein
MGEIEEEKESSKISTLQYKKSISDSDEDDSSSGGKKIKTQEQQDKTPVGRTVTQGNNYGILYLITSKYLYETYFLSYQIDAAELGVIVPYHRSNSDEELPSTKDIAHLAPKKLSRK